MKVQKFREEKERREKEAAAKVAREKEERERREAKEKARKEKEARALLAAERQARKERKEREQKKTEEKARKVALRKARLQNIAKGIKNIIRGESKLPFFIGGGIVIVFLLGFIIKGALPSTAPSPLTETSTIPALPSAALSEIPTNLTPTHTSVPSATLGSIVTITPSPLLTGSPVPTVTTLPAEIIDDFGVAMMLVPAGEFLMGSEVGDEAHYDERPPRTVYLDVYYIDKYEVTNAKYRDCVTSGSCQLPTRDYTRLHSNYFSDTYYDNYPVVNVNWFMAEAYCNWRRGQLPTEAQWEKAARGRDGRMFPWGERINCYKANIGRSDDGSFCNDDKGDTLEVV